MTKRIDAPPSLYVCEGTGRKHTSARDEETIYNLHGKLAAECLYCGKAILRAHVRSSHWYTEK